MSKVIKIDKYGQNWKNQRIFTKRSYCPERIAKTQNNESTTRPSGIYYSVDMSENLKSHRKNYQYLFELLEEKKREKYNRNKL